MAEDVKLLTQHELDQFSHMLENTENVKWSNQKPLHVYQYVEWMIESYRKNHLRGEQLFADYSTDFYNFGEAGFAILNKPQRATLRTFLQENGVWVHQEKRYPVARALAEAADIWTPSPAKVPKTTSSGDNDDDDDDDDDLPSRTPGSGFPGGGIPGGGYPGKRNRGGHHDSSFDDDSSHRRLPTAREQFRQAAALPLHQYSRELTTLTKTFPTESKYSGTPDQSFDLSLSVFIELCKDARIPGEAYRIAFPKMLKGEAFQYYCLYLQGKNLPLEQLYDAINIQF